MQRRLAAILAADIAGYSRLMGENEEATVRDLKGHQAVVLPLISQHGGHIIDTAGDGILAEFPSVVGAVQCAVEIQTVMAVRNEGVRQERRMLFRVGVNLGDVIDDAARIYGDGLNVAARLEGTAEPGGICISEDAFRQVRGKIEVEFQDLGEHSLKNIAHPLRVYRLLWQRPGTPRPAALPLPNKPSIAVLPFQNLSGDSEQEYFVDGMAEEITTALSRIRWLFVIARNSSFTYKGQAIDVKRIGRELGVRYLLEGSARKSGNRVRITGQLIEAETGVHLWADRFDGSLEDVFDLQDRVASSVAGVIEPALQAAETARSSNQPTNDLTAYDLYLLAYAMFWSSAQVPKALALLEQAIERDPRYGLALAWAAICCYRMLQDGRSEDREADRLKGHTYARRALEVAGDDPAVLANAADALAFFGEDIVAMMALADRALALNPNYARGWHVSGVVRLEAGLPDIAIEHAKVSLRLSPRARIGSTMYVMGFAQFLSRRFDDAVPNLRLAIQENPAFIDPYRVLAACYARMGRLDDARETIARLRAITSVVIPDHASPLRNPEQREFLLSSLRLAKGEK